MPQKPLQIKTAVFAKGIIGTDSILQKSFPQVAFVGRSNVGKSSLINSLVGQKHLAHASGLPGKTREINFFLINGAYYFVDLPGYGFAKIREKAREKLRKLIIWYLSSGEARPRAVVHIVDALVGMTAFDKEMLEILQKESIHVIFVANKIDRVSRGKYKSISEGLVQASGGLVPLLYSAKTKQGREELLASINEALDVKQGL
ncbi:MAG: ribosome biogenesis GTP-binding protein YihA/YsxC [Minisyncoccota bacterium]